MKIIKILSIKYESSYNKVLVRTVSFAIKSGEAFQKNISLNYNTSTFFCFFY